MKNRVRFYRQQKVLTQNELGELIGVQGQTIANIEKAKHKPRPKTIRALSAALGVAIEDLFPAENNENSAAA